MSKLLEKIRGKTQVMHEELEDTLRLFERCTTRDAYLGVLKKFFAFYTPLVRQISRLGLHAEAEKVGLRAQWLTEDLKSMNLTDQQVSLIAECSELPSFKNADEVLGFCYVLEGSTLGGQVIRRHFQKLWNQESDEGLRFFSAYGAETGPHWRSFMQQLETKSAELSESQQQDVVQGAFKTFESLKNWMSQ